MNKRCLLQKNETLSTSAGTAGQKTLKGKKYSAQDEPPNPKRASSIITRFKNAPTAHQQAAVAVEQCTEKQHYRDPMNRNTTHISTNYPKGNDLKGCAMHSTQPSIFSLPLCPFLGRPFHPVLASTSSRQRAPLHPSLRAKRSNPNLKETTPFHAQTQQRKSQTT